MSVQVPEQAEQVPEQVPEEVSKFPKGCGDSRGGSGGGSGASSGKFRYAGMVLCWRLSWWLVADVLSCRQATLLA